MSQQSFVPETQTKSIQLKDYLIYAIENIFTLGNLLCGLYGIFLTFDGNILGAFQFLLLGAFFDLFDGKLAKISGIKSQFGEYADSFSDLMTFALLPGFMVLALKSALWLGDIEIFSNFTFGQIFAGVYAIGGWYRLIRFSAKPTGARFEGLPSAAAAMFIGAFTVIVFETPNLPLNILLTIAIIISGLLMSSTIIYPSPKRMFQSDNILITVAGVVGFLYVIVPNEISALMVLFISILYTAAGPYYFIKTQDKTNV